MGKCTIPEDPNPDSRLAEVESLDVARRNRRNKRAGAKWQSTLRDGLRSAGLDVEVLPQTGVEDEGDLVVRLGGGHRWVVIEAKAGTMHPSDFVDQTRAETNHFARHRGIDPARVSGIAVVKRRNYAWERAYVLTDVASYFRLPIHTPRVQPAGKSWPRVLCTGLRSAGFEAELLPHNPAAMEGDLVIRDGLTAKVVKAKAGTLRVGELVDQMQAETLAYARHRDMDPRRVEGLAIVKRRTAPWSDAYVLTELGDYFGLGD